MRNVFIVLIMVVLSAVAGWAYEDKVANFFRNCFLRRTKKFLEMKKSTQVPLLKKMIGELMNIFDYINFKLSLTFFTVFVAYGLFTGLKVAEATKNDLADFSEPDFGFSITPPHGWVIDKDGSETLTSQTHQNNKNNYGVVFISDKRNIEPMHLNLMLMFDKSNVQVPDLEGLTKDLSQLEMEYGGGSKDDRNVYKSQTLSIGRWKGIQTVMCTSYPSGPTCNLVQHVTRLYSSQGMITILFNISKEEYPSYEKEVDQVLTSIKEIPMVSKPLLPICQKNAIRITEVNWEKRMDYLSSIEILIKANLTNLNDTICMVKVVFQMIDKNGEIIVKTQSLGYKELKKKESKSVSDTEDVKKALLERVVEIRALVSQIQ
ncbi:MAG: hypothetical protein HYR79_04440 [Nitrospirae bacterium]|nr:hypothetical protein [Nitrospirota bacterium]